MAFLVLNLGLLGAWAWAQTERQQVTIVASGSGVSALVDGQPLAAMTSPTDHGRVGLYIGERGPVLGREPPAVVARLARESAWASLTVRRIRDDAVLFRRDFPLGDGLLVPDEPTAEVVGFGDPDWRDYVVEAELLRGRELAGVEVYGTAEGGQLFLFRPEHRDVGWWQRTPRGLQGPLVAAPYRAFRKDLTGMIQDNLRLLLRAYPAALGLALLAWALGGLGALASRVRRAAMADGGAQDTPTPDPSPRAGREALCPPACGGTTGGAADPTSDRTGSPSLPASVGAGLEPAPARFARARGDDRRGPGGRIATFLALAISAAAFALAACVAYFLLERMPHVQDSVAYYFQAKLFALGRLWAPTPPLPEFFVHEFVVMHEGRWFGKYPPGHPALLAVGVLLGLPWLINPLAAALSLILVYLIGRQLYGAGTGLVAGALGLTSPFFIFMSGSFMAHPTGLLFTLLFVWLLFRSRRWTTGLVAGAALGVAFLIRPWTAGIVAAPFALAALAGTILRPAAAWRMAGQGADPSPSLSPRWGEESPPSRRGKGGRGSGPRLAATGHLRSLIASLASLDAPRYLAMAAGFLPFVAVWLGYNAALTGSPFKNPMELWWDFDRVGFGPGHGPYGHTPLDGLWNTSRNVGELLTHLFGWPPFLTLAFVTLPFVVGRARRADLLLLAAFVALVGGYALWWADGIMFGPRFHYEGLGFLLLLTSRGVFETAGLVQRAVARWGRRARWPGPVAAGGLLCLLVLYNLVFYLPGQWQLYHGYNHVNRGPVRAVESAGLHNALVFAYVGEWHEWWNYGMVFSSNSPLLDTDVVYARDLGDAENQKLMALYPGRAYYRLRGTSLTPISP